MKDQQTKKNIRLGWNDVNEEQRNEIYSLIIKHVNDNHCCRVGWACKRVMGEYVQENVLDKIAAQVVYNPRYIKETANINFEYDWNIIKNPAGIEKVRDRIIAGAITITAVLLGAFLNHILSSNSQNEKQIVPQIQIVHDTVYIKTNVDSLNANRLNVIPSN